MSKEPEFWKTCVRKKRIRTEKFARQKVEEAKTKYNAEMRYYFCPYCSSYHLTKKEQAPLHPLPERK